MGGGSLVLGHQSLLPALSLDLDLAGARRLRLWNRDRQHALRVARLDLVALDVLGQPNRALERSVDALGRVDTDLLVLLRL